MNIKKQNNLSRLFFEELAEMLRTARLRKCLSQAEVAALVDISQASISRLENCKHGTDVLNCLRLINFYEIHIEVVDPGADQKIKM